MRRVLIVFALLLDGACGRPASLPGPEAQTPTPAPDPVEPTEDEQADAEPESDSCDPEPLLGQPCEHEASFCVIDWGEPGGHSTAMWCRGGRWEREQEMNLPDDDAAPPP